MADEKFDFLVVIEGEANPRVVPGRLDATVEEVLALVAKDTGRTELVDLFIEDGDDPLVAGRTIRELVEGLDKLLHVATKGQVKVTVEYGQHSVSREFRPSATMERIIRWAAKEKQLNIEAPVEDLQLKLGKEVLPADTHLGQVTQGRKEITFQLVFKIKPQG